MKYVTWNMNGTKEYEKVRDSLMTFKRASVKIVLLQEVHRLDDDKQFIRWCKELGWKTLVKGLKTNSGGLAVLSIDEDILLLDLDADRRWMVVCIGNQKFLNVYAPAEGVKERCQ